MKEKSLPLLLNLTKNKSFELFRKNGGWIISEVCGTTISLAIFLKKKYFYFNVFFYVILYKIHEKRKMINLIMIYDVCMNLKCYISNT